ncbi:MAG: hypothetical protein HYS32_03790 [Candidatus Woesearchaeota archaeon]|nr:MAG: hypothetical protein HYS32_03790 [Candidatus Woesearchaeota archaeon]
MERPFLYDTVDFLYSSVMDNMPEVLRERSMASAFVLGATGIYGTVRLLQFASKNLVERLFPGFHDKVLPKIEKICTVGMATTPFLYALIDPDGAKQIMVEHPTYTSGMAGVYVGSIAAALQDLRSKSNNKLIEERVKR